MTGQDRKINTFLWPCFWRCIKHNYFYSLCQFLICSRFDIFLRLNIFKKRDPWVNFIILHAASATDESAFLLDSHTACQSENRIILYSKMAPAAWSIIKCTHGSLFDLIFEICWQMLLSWILIISKNPAPFPLRAPQPVSPSTLIRFWERCRFVKFYASFPPLSKTWKRNPASCLTKHSPPPSLRKK